MLKNIIMINDECGLYGGGAKVSAFEVNELAKKYNVVFFCGWKGDISSFNPKIEIISVYDSSFLDAKNKISSIFAGLYSFKAKKAMKQLLNRFSKEDTVIHITGFITGLSSSIFSPIYKSGIKTFYTIHAYHLACPNGGFFNYPKNKICTLKPCSIKCQLSNCDSRNYYFKIYRNIRQIIQNYNFKLGKNKIHYIFLSKLSKEAIIKYLKPQSPYKFIHNPVETRDLTISNIENNDTFLFVGRVQKEKGIEILCEFVEKKKIKLLIIGNGPLEDSLKEKYKNNKNIVFAGWQNYDFITQKMACSRALIFSSLWYECEPLTVLEAKSMGLPVMVSNLCASVENVTEKSGVIYNPYDYDDFSKKIDILNNDEKIIEMSKNSYLEFNEYVNKNHHIDELIDFYKNTNNTVYLQ